MTSLYLEAMKRVRCVGKRDLFFIKVVSDKVAMFASVSLLD